FEELHPEIDVEVSGGGSSKGVTDAQSGRVDLGMASRDLKSSETGVESRQLAIDAIALIVHPNCTLDNVTAEEAFHLYAYATPVGSVVKGIARSSSSGTRDAFDSLVSADGVLLADVSLADGVQELESGGLVVTTIQGNTAGDTMGYVSLGAVTEQVKSLSFDGVPATVENVESGAYELCRPFNLVWKSGTQFTTATQTFFDFVFGAQGRAIIQAEGYVLG
ncbi:MAG: substrate-binding domain-containing protein, partial [Clostridia bacterium]|nr:substrate-binding domain-containing protein [Clostridia bacterium]